MNAPDGPKKNKIKKDREKSGEDSDSFVDSMKNEWSLFWEGFVGEDEDPTAGKKEILPEHAILTLEQIKSITKALSTDRKKLNMKLEEIRKEIEESATRLETLKLVGSPGEDTLERLNELSDQGQAVNEQLNKINERLRFARRREDEIKKAPRPT